MTDQQIDTIYKAKEVAMNTFMKYSLAQGVVVETTFGEVYIDRDFRVITKEDAVKRGLVEA